MTVPDIEITRARRARRARVQLVVTAAAVIATLSIIVVAPNARDLVGVAVVIQAALIIGSSVAVARDEWHRSKALLGIAIAFAVGVGWQVVEALRVTFDPSHRPSVGRALNVIAAAWLMADYLIRQRPDSDD